MTVISLKAAGLLMQQRCTVSVKVVLSFTQNDCMMGVCSVHRLRQDVDGVHERHDAAGCSYPGCVPARNQPIHEFERSIGYTTAVGLGRLVD
jgi:hypothetical protein